METSFSPTENYSKAIIEYKDVVQLDLANANALLRIAFSCGATNLPMAPPNQCAEVLEFKSIPDFVQRDVRGCHPII
jgi:hypothetical protein